MLLEIEISDLNTMGRIGSCLNNNLACEESKRDTFKEDYSVDSKKSSGSSVAIQLRDGVFYSADSLLSNQRGSNGDEPRKYSIRASTSRIRRSYSYEMLCK